VNKIPTFLFRKLFFSIATHERKFANEIVSSNDSSLPLHQRTAAEVGLN